MLRFRVFGVPFQVGGFFWLSCVLLSGLGNSLSENHAILRLTVWVACVFVSIVTHEMGHALAGRCFGASPSVILQALGGMTHLPGARLKRGQSILVSLAGPVAGFALWGAVRLLSSTMAGPFDLTDPVILGVLLAVVYLGIINGVWTIFNLLPILPLDGGQVLRDALGPRWIGATRTIGGVTAAVAAGFSLQGRQIYLAFFLGYLAYLNFRGNPGSLPGGVSK